MKVLVINAGSSSLKYQLIDMENERMIAKGLCERIGTEGALLKGSGKDGVEIKIDSPMPTHNQAIDLVLKVLTDKEVGVVSSMDEINAVGHRVVHSGLDFDSSVEVTDDVLKACVANIELAPLHMPANIAGIEACKAVMPTTKNVAVFDTAFHAKMPQKAAIYGLPYEVYEEWKMKKYGFHGTSHKFVSDEAAKFLGKDVKDLKIVTCHLGNGSSVSAVDGGISIDTSMGLTPLEGLPMGTRCGDLDPACVEFIMNKSGMSIGDTMNYLNKKSGMLGISGVSSDFRDLCATADSNPRSKLALDIFSYRVMKYVASYAGAMGGLDVIVFTGGVGENTEEVRRDALASLKFMGVEVCPDLNKKYSNGGIYKAGIQDISTSQSNVRVLVIPTNEELVIARETCEVIGK